MSDKERTRLKVIAELVKPSTNGRKQTQAQGATLLGCGERHVRRLLAPSARLNSGAA